MNLKPQKIALLAIVMLALVGFIATITLQYPGYMSPDSVQQLQQGRSGVFFDWHPPVMSWIWGQIDQSLPGPLGMFFFQSLLFWGGLAVWAYFALAENSGLAACLALVIIGSLPPIFFNLGPIWKDIEMAAVLLLASGSLLGARRNQSWLALGVGLIALWYAIATRHNAIIAAAPLAIYASLILVELLGKRISTEPKKRLAILVLGLGILGLLVVTNSKANHNLTRGITLYPVQQILVHDLVAISLAKEEVLLPDFLPDQGQKIELADLKAIYSTETVVYLYCCNQIDLRFRIVSSPEQFRAIAAEWLNAVISNPSVYLAHRYHVFLDQLAINREQVCYPLHYGIVENKLGIQFEDIALNQELALWAAAYRNTIIYRGWFYLALLILGLAAAAIGYKKNPPAYQAILAVGLSGLLYMLAYFFISTTCDFRMHFWSVLTALLLVAWIPTVWLKNWKQANLEK